MRYNPIPDAINKFGDTMTRVLQERKDKSEQQIIGDFFSQNELTPANLQRFRSMYPNIDMGSVIRQAPVYSEMRLRQEVSDIGNNVGAEIDALVASGKKPDAQTFSSLFEKHGSGKSWQAKQKATEILMQSMASRDKLFQKNYKEVGQNSALVNVDDPTDRIAGPTKTESPTLTSNVTQDANGNPVYAFNNGTPSSTPVVKMASEPSEDLKEDRRLRREQSVREGFASAMRAYQDDAQKIKDTTAKAKEKFGLKDDRKKDWPAITALHNQHNKSMDSLKNKYTTIFEPYRKEGLWHGWEGEQNTPTGSVVQTEKQPASKTYSDIASLPTQGIPEGYVAQDQKTGKAKAVFRKGKWQPL